MPSPDKNETEKHFVERCIPIVIEEGTAKDGAQASAICHSMYMEKKTSTMKLGQLSYKEEEGEFYSTGYVATTHPDRAADPTIEVEGDILSKESLEQIADWINKEVATTDGLGATRIVSLNHDWIKESNPDLPPAGIVIPPAEVVELDDGHYGVKVTVHHNKEHPDFDSIKYKVEHGYIPGYSIEYAPGEYEKVSYLGKTYRFLKNLTNYAGHAFASARKIANPMAVITGFTYKEIKEEVSKMEEQKNDVKEVIETSTEPVAEVKEQVVQEQTEEVKEVIETKEEEVQEEVKDESSETKEVDSTIDSVEVKETPVDMKEVVEEVLESKEYKEQLDSIKPTNKVLKTKEEAKMSISIKEMDTALRSNDVLSYKEAANAYLEETKLFEKAIGETEKYGFYGTKSNLNIKAVDKGLKIVGGLQMKATLGTGDNTSSYTQADVEFADVFAPGIIDTFNNQTNLFGFLPKIQHVGGEHYQWKMVTNKDPNTVSTFVGHNDTAVTKNFADKSNYQTPLKIARRGISVTDFMNRYSARSLGDLFQLEVDLQMKEMMNDINAALFAEVADGTGNSPLGLEAVADSAGNTTLYGLTRSAANRLSPDTAADTYLAVGGALTEAALRTKMTNLETEGTRMGDMAIVASPATRDLLFNLLDGQRRFNTTEASFGFNKMTVPSYDGVPIIVDSDCNSDAIYVIDISRDGAAIVVGMPPTITNLAKVGAATEAYVQMDFAFVYHQPRRIGMLDTLS